MIWFTTCRKQIEPEIGEIPVAFVAKTEGSELTEDDVKQFVAKEVNSFTMVIHRTKRKHFTMADRLSIVFLFLLFLH